MVSASRFWNSAFGLRRESDLDAVLARFEQAPPRLVFHAPDDKYNTTLSDRLMDYVRAHYLPWGQIGALQVYRLSAEAKPEFLTAEESGRLRGNFRDFLKHLRVAEVVKLRRVDPVLTDLECLAAGIAARR